jgi:hypothetical protein
MRYSFPNQNQPVDGRFGETDQARPEAAPRFARWREFLKLNNELGFGF